MSKVEEFKTLAKRITPGDWGHNAEDDIHSKVQTPEGMKIATTYGDDLGGYRAMYNAVYIAWCGRESALIAEALAFFERKEAIRAAIAGLKHGSDEPGIESYSTACVDAALAAFDREAK